MLVETLRQAVAICQSSKTQTAVALNAARELAELADYLELMPKVRQKIEWSLQARKALAIDRARNAARKMKPGDTVRFKASATNKTPDEGTILRMCASGDVLVHFPIDKTLKVAAHALKVVRQ